MLGNPWFIAITSSLLTAVLIFSLRSVVVWFRLCFGKFSGHYIAYTWDEGSHQVLVEHVSCRHIGDTLRGRIRGVVLLHVETDSKEAREAGTHEGLYGFHGSVDERLFVISYKTSAKLGRSAGAIALQGDSSEERFDGSWAGLVGDRLAHAYCTWQRLDHRISPTRRRAAFIDLARHHLPLLDSVDRLSDLICWSSFKGSRGLASFLHDHTVGVKGQIFSEMHRRMLERQAEEDRDRETKSGDEDAQQTGPPDRR